MMLHYMFLSTFVCLTVSIIKKSGFKKLSVFLLKLIYKTWGEEEKKRKLFLDCLENVGSGVKLLVQEVKCWKREGQHTLEWLVFPLLQTIGGVVIFSPLIWLIKIGRVQFLSIPIRG